MKKLFLFIILCSLFLLTSNVNAKNLQAYLFYTTFFSPVDGPYLETYLSIKGESVNFIEKDNGKYQGIIAVTIIFRENEEIVEFAKYEVRSPEVEDTTMINFDFIDQQRYALPNGKFVMELIISDMNGKIKPSIITEPIQIDYPDDEISISGIGLIDSYKKSEETSILTRGDYDFIPYVYNFYPEHIDKLLFYNEIYHSEEVLGKDQMFLVSYYIESFETGKKLVDFVRNKRENTDPVVALLGTFDISRLPSGNYNLVIEARNRNNELITRNKLFFQRSNPNISFNTQDLAAVSIENTFVSQIDNPDTLRQYINYLYPISTEMERLFINRQLGDADMLTMQQFFLNFWSVRDNFKPQKAWAKYHHNVKKVNVSFKTPFLQGYETDRGRVYLKYGPPNIISESYNEPAAYPYEIWQYYTLGNNQRNKRFVFYTEDIVTNNFQLVHSDAIGEISNYRWQVFIHRRTYDPDNLDIDRYYDAWGSKVNIYYDNPH